MSINAAIRDMEGVSREVKAREAGHILYNSFSNSHNATTRVDLNSYPPYTSSVPHSVVASQEVPPNTASVEGGTPKGRISAVRRTFILFVLFDLIFTFILWVLYTQISGIQPLSQAFIQQVENYEFSSSLFDTVMCAAYRFTILILAYALFRSRKPWFVALTTLGTIVFLIAKAIWFDYHNHKPNTMFYSLLIVSFVIAWVQTWFLDFKVIPQETKALEREEFNRIISERTPLLHGHSSRYDVASTDQYYSPEDSGSEDEEGRQNEGFNSIPGSRHSRASSRASFNLTLGSQEQELLKKGKESWEVSWQIYQDTEDWHLESGDPATGSVHSKHLNNHGKIFKLEGIVDIPPKQLLNELFYNLTDLPKWNPTLLECRALQIIDENTDICYSVAAEAAGGLVSSRDFITVRHWAVREGVYLAAGVACTHPDMPVQKKHVRGENGPGGCLMIPVPGEPTKCVFRWILNTNLKGWLPQYLIDQALSGVLLEYLKYLREHAKTLSTSEFHDM